MRNYNLNMLSMLDNGLDTVINIASLLAAYILMPALNIPIAVPIESSVSLSVLLLTVIISSFIYRVFDLYRPIPYIRIRFAPLLVVFANICLFGSIVVFSLIFYEDEKRSFLVILCVVAMIISTMAIVMKRKVVILAVSLSRRQKDDVRKVIIVGDNRDSANTFIEEVINDKRNKLILLGGVGTEILESVRLQRLGNFEDLGGILRKYKPDYAVFAIDSYDKRVVTGLVNLCDEQCVKVFFLPVIYGFFKSARQIEFVGDMPLINLHTTPLDIPLNAFLKRSVDIWGSLMLILITFPLMIVCAIGVKLSSPGPILFKQVRVGKMGREFLMLKFRSMRVNDEAETAWTTGNDPRKTRFGAFIRKTSLDELPQFFNVLRGEMSLVGPRPEIPHYVNRFRNNIPLYMVKHYVKPGITGLAQISGLRGDTSVEERIYKDVSYLENWSLLLDILILLKTPFAAFNKNERFSLESDSDNSNKPEK